MLVGYLIDSFISIWLFLLIKYILINIILYIGFFSVIIGRSIFLHTCLIHLFQTELFWVLEGFSEQEVD